MAAIQCGFFDIGGTLGDVDAQLKLHVYADSRPLIESLKAPNRRFGIISNVPPAPKSADLVKLLHDAGIGDLFDDELVIASTDAPKPKPDAAI